MANFVGTTGRDNFTGTEGNDVFLLNQGGKDTAVGGAGDDLFILGDTLTANDSIHGGTGNDTLMLDGDYSAGLILNPQTITGIENIDLSEGHDYNITLSDNNVDVGATLNVDGSGLHGGDRLTFDGRAETDGHLSVRGGIGNDTIWGGAGTDIIYGGDGDDTIRGGLRGDTIGGGDGTDIIYGGGGPDVIAGGLGQNDQLHGGAGLDTFVYTGVVDSTGLSYDTVFGFDATQDIFDLNVSVTGIDPAITTGRLDEATYNADLEAAANPTTLGEHHAVLFTPDSGSDQGELYLIVEANGNAGYQSNKDYVIELDNAHNMDALALTNFV